MSALAVSLGVFAVVVVGTLAGAFLRGVLPAHHLSDESKDVVKLGIGLIATLAALVLGLLVSTAKSSYDTKSEEIKASAAKIILLDRNLRQYGPEANQVRAMARRAAVSRVNQHWLESNFSASGGDREEGASASEAIENIQHMLRALSPTTNAQRDLQSRALELTRDLAQMRWLLLEQRGSTIPTPFLVVLVFWLALIFGSMGLFAPRNGTVYTIILVCALSASSAIFLILEMDRPFEGLLRISDAPLRDAISHLDR